MDCTIYVAKTKVLVSCVIIAQLICAFVLHMQKEGFLMPRLISYEPPHEKTNIYICENKDADQLRGDREDDQRLCFHYIDTTIPLLSKSEISSF